MKKHLIYLLVFCFTAPVITCAQYKLDAADTVIKGATIEIVHKYKAEVRQAAKPEYIPTLPPQDTALPHFNYIVPQQSLLYTYNSPPLNPLALGIDSSTTEKPNYVKLGGGNLSTIYLDAGLDNLKYGALDANIHLHHFSQDASLKYQQWAASGIEANGLIDTKHNQWHTQLDLERNHYNYYGFDHSIYNPPSDSVNQTYWAFHAGATLKNYNETIGQIKYGSIIDFYYQKDSHGASENTISYSLPAIRTIDSNMQLLGRLDILITDFSNPANNASNNIFKLSAGLNYNWNVWRLHAVLSPSLVKDGAYFLPDLNLNARLFKSAYNFSIGWQSYLVQNSFQQLTASNPFIFNTYATKQSHNDEVFAIISNSFGNHLAASAGLSWWQLNDLPQFLNDVADGKQFYLQYISKTSAFALHINATYSVSNFVTIGLNAAYNNYSANVLNRPNTEFNGNITVKPTNKLTLIAYLNIWNGIKAIDLSHNIITMPAVLNIQADAEYSFINRLSGFVQMNNLLNNKNQLWLGYDSFGLTLYLGLRLKF
jgi:hypothetical protein